MRILHTADWHLGQFFFDRSRIPEQRCFLDYLLQTIETQAIDLLIVAGDVFDTANPPRAAEHLYYEFLTQLYSLKTCQALIIGGNHDSALHLDAPRRILAHLKIEVVGAFPSANPETALFHYEKDGKHLHVAAVPYLRDRDVRKAVEGESFDAMEARTKAGIVQVYADMAERMNASPKKKGPVIATGHLTAVGGKLSDSERSIHIGNLGSIRADQFAPCFDYIALGHLHHPQSVGSSEHIRYAGSPIPLSFSESLEKELRLLTINDQGGIDQKAIPIPLARQLIRIQGNIDHIQTALAAIEVDPDALTPWIEVTLTDGQANAATNDTIRQFAAAQGLEVLKVTVRTDRALVGELDPASGKSIREWSPQEVFSRRIDHYEGVIAPNQLDDCFREVLHAVQEGGEA